MSGIEIVREAAKQGRVNRQPRHTFQIRHRPWQVQPMMIAPVLPGETMKNLLLQARVVTDPIKNPLIGWWYEFYFFYVKHRDLAARDTLMEMHLTPGYSIAALNAAANAATYHPGPGVDWSRQCLNEVILNYFRDDDEEGTTFEVDGLPLANINSESWLDSAKREIDTPAGGQDHDLAGENPDIADRQGIPTGFENHYTQWEHMRALKLTDATFEDYLKSFGVKPARETVVEEIHKPELLRYVRDWTYPSNTVNPADGIPASAASWAISERADKDRFFSEPGFIFGCAVARPKVYLAKQKGAGVSMMNDAYSWLPAVLHDEPYTSLKRFLSTEGPLQGNTGTEPYWVDIRDLFVYGDQFVNFDLAATDAGLVALPTTGLQKKYPVAADMDAMFKTPASAKLVRADGVVSLTIASRVTDTSL